MIKLSQTVSIPSHVIFKEVGGEAVQLNQASAKYSSLDAGFKQLPNMCAYIRSPGYWANYQNHLSDATSLTIIQATQDFKTLTIAGAVKILNNTKVQFSMFLLAAELNAVWNGNDNNPGIGGTFGSTVYYYPGSSLNGMTVNEILALGFAADPKEPGTDLNNAIVYLGHGGETDSVFTCRIQ